METKAQYAPVKFLSGREEARYIYGRHDGTDRLHLSSVPLWVNLSSAASSPTILSQFLTIRWICWAFSFSAFFSCVDIYINYRVCQEHLSQVTTLLSTVCAFFLFVFFLQWMCVAPLRASMEFEKWEKKAMFKHSWVR